MSAPRFISLFETPLIVTDLPDLMAEKTTLLRLIRARKTTHAGVRKSNWLGWQSEPDMLDWGGEAVRALAGHFLGICNKFTATPSVNSSPFIWGLDIWANVSGLNAANEAHMHPGAVWSGVYYVETGSDAGEAADVGGDLVLYDPRMPAPRTLPFDLRYRNGNGEGYQSHHEIRPQEGRLVVFPPWLLHSVRPYLGTGERVSIALNAMARPAPESGF